MNTYILTEESETFVSTSNSLLQNDYQSISKSKGSGEP